MTIWGFGCKQQKHLMGSLPGISKNQKHRAQQGEGLETKNSLLGWPPLRSAWALLPGGMVSTKNMS